MPRVLTAATVATCPHGGRAAFRPGQTRVTASGSPVLTAGTITVVTGCPRQDGPGPCTTVTWSQPSTRVAAAGSPLLLETSVGTCVSATSAPQGQLVLVDVQPRVHAG